ncbi:hypothetical protein N9V49_03985 [Flavobacteriaceae bacterium]|nr:hypothetical protein [Flavobacteriaceae bacterium]
MKKLLLLSSLFLALSCGGLDDEEITDAGDPLGGYVLNFLEVNDGKGFVYSDGDSDQYLFFYDSDIFLKEVIVYYPELDSYCSTTKEGSNTDDGYNFTAEILRNDSLPLQDSALDVRITYTGDDGNTVSSIYEYRQVCNTIDCLEWRIRVTANGSIKTYSETSMKHASLCN